MSGGDSGTRDIGLTVEIPLAEIIDRLLDRGVVLTGGATISVAGVDLVELRLSVLLASVDAFARSLERGSVMEAT